MSAFLTLHGQWLGLGPKLKKVVALGGRPNDHDLLRSLRCRLVAAGITSRPSVPP